MGRMIWTIVICLLLTATSCAGSRWEIDRAAGGMIQPLSCALQAFESGETEAAMEKLYAARTHWEAHRKWLLLLVAHNKMETAAEMLDRCEYALKYGHAAWFQSECRALLRRMEDLMEEERLLWENLL